MTTLAQKPDKEINIALLPPDFIVETQKRKNWKKSIFFILFIIFCLFFMYFFHLTEEKDEIEKETNSRPLVSTFSDNKLLPVNGESNPQNKSSIDKTRSTPLPSELDRHINKDLRSLNNTVQAVSENDTINDRSQETSFNALKFDFQDDNLNSANQNGIKQIVNRIGDRGGKLILKGHTCSVGSYESNMELSELRVKNVESELKKNGLNQDVRIYRFYLGETQPIDSNETEMGRINNRRVDISFIPKK